MLLHRPTTGIIVLLAMLLSLIAPATLSDALYNDSSLNSDTLLQFTSGGHVLGFGQKSVYLAGLDHALQVKFEGARLVPPVVENTGKIDRNIASLGSVRYSNIWQNIDVIFNAATGSIAESTYIIHPGGSPSDISLSYNVPVNITADGELRFSFASGYMIESAPVAWQEINGERLEIAVHCEQQSNENVGFSLGSHDRSHTVYIDPTYYWHTFCGAGGEVSSGIAVDTSGNIYVTGIGSSLYTSGPGGETPRHAFTGTADILVVKLDSSGAYQWHTFYGSASTDYGVSIAVDASGNVYVAGESSGDWNGTDNATPLHGYAGDYDITVIGLDSDGYYRWHTFYGNINDDIAGGIAVDTAGYVCITGSSSESWDGPGPTPPLHPYTHSSITVLKLDTGGAYQWHTFFGPESYGITAQSIAVDTTGYIYVTGDTYGTWNGTDNTTPLHGYSGGIDIFVLKLGGSGSYQWHTFYGSAGSDHGMGIALDTSGNIGVAGYSNATWNGPGEIAPLHTYAGGTDIITLMLDNNGGYRWHTFYGSAVEDEAQGIAIDSTGNVYVTGKSDATWKAGDSDPLNAFAGGKEIAVLGLDSEGAYLWHTFYGSAGDEGWGAGVAVDSSHSVCVAGTSTISWDGPGGAAPVDAFVAGAGVCNIAVIKTGYILPTATTMAASGTGNNQATLNMSYTTGEYSTVDVRFAYKKSSDSTWLYTTAASKSTDGTHSETVYGLDSNTQYDFLAELTYDSTTIQGSTIQFTTGKVSPSVSTSAATGAGVSSVTLNMNYTVGDYSPVQVRFAYKKAAAGAWTYTSWIARLANGTYAQALAGLDPNMLYDFRAELKYNSSEIPGSTLQFTTEKNLPTITTQPATELTSGSATLNMNYSSGDFGGVKVRFTYRKAGNTSWGYTAWKSKGGIGTYAEMIKGLAAGARYEFRAELLFNSTVIQGNILQFNTVYSAIGTGPHPSSGSSSTSSITQSPVSLPNIYIQEASLSASNVTPGAPVTVTARISNRGTVNGSTSVKLYVNGNVDASQGITVNSGSTSSVTFTVSRNEPGTYSVYVGGTSAGNFIVQDTINPDIILLVSCMLIFFAFVTGVIYIARRKLTY